MKLETLLQSNLTFPLLVAVTVIGIIGVVIFVWTTTELRTEPSAAKIKSIWVAALPGDQLSVAKNSQRSVD